MEEPLARKLGTFGAWDWLLNKRPWQVTALLFVLSPGLLWLLDVLVVRGYVLPLSYQWLSAVCDALLAVAGGLMAWQLRSVAIASPMWRPRVRGVAHAGLVAVWWLVGGLHMWQERASVPTWERRLGPTSVYHNFVLYPLIGYPLTAMLILVCMHIRLRSLAHMLRFVAIVLCFATWIWAGSSFDGHHQVAPNGVDKHVYSSPGPPYSGNPWCGGLLTRQFCGCVVSWPCPR